MATPMLRVVVSLVEAIRMRDWFFVGTTLTVVLLLSVSLVLSFQRRWSVDGAPGC